MANEIMVPKVDVEKIEQSLLVPDVIQALSGKPPVIKTEQDKLKAVDELQRIKGEIKRLDADRKTFTDPLNAVVKAINERFKLSLNPLSLAEEVYKKAITAWDVAEQERIRKENERLQREAEEKARKEQERLAKAAEKAAAKGDEAKAEELQQKAIQAQEQPVIAPVIQPRKVAGISYKDKWTAVVADLNLVPRDYLIVDQKKLDAVAQATGGTIRIPGVVIKHEKVMSSASR